MPHLKIFLIAVFAVLKTIIAPFATRIETCEFYERGLLRPGEDYDVTPPYLMAPCDPMDDEGYVHLPQGPGLGMELNWDYINDNLVEE